jgi:hypothetical protein
MSDPLDEIRKEDSEPQAHLSSAIRTLKGRRVWEPSWEKWTPSISYRMLRRSGCQT